MNKKRVLFFTFIFLIIIAVILFYNYKKTNDVLDNKIAVGKCQFNIEVAKTPQARQQGLSGRESFPQNSAMLFIFEKPDIYSFWMKDMNFPLDFVWIRENLVVDLSDNISPPQNDKNIPRAVPKSPVDKVLEINTGKIKECNIKVDQTIKNLPESF